MIFQKIIIPVRIGITGQPRIIIPVRIGIPENIVPIEKRTPFAAFIGKTRTGAPGATGATAGATGGADAAGSAHLSPNAFYLSDKNPFRQSLIRE